MEKYVMIVIDFSSISIANIFVLNFNKELTENAFRHMILNTLCYYRKKFKKFGHVFLACDHGSWRKDVYKYYKAQRKKEAEKSDINWSEIYQWLNDIKSELDDYSPFTVLDVKNTEADDIIGILVRETQKFGQHEEVMIISADKDFKQLQIHSNVRQYSNLLKKYLDEKNPLDYLFKHICRGDNADGIPNILSSDDTFVDEEKRQRPLRSKRIEILLDGFKRGEDLFECEEHRRNWQRNAKLIDLRMIPKNIVNNIIKEINEKDKRHKKPNQMKMMNYLIDKKCDLLLERLTDFF